MSLWNESVEELRRTLRDNGLWRAYVITTPDGEMQTSHECIGDVADALRRDKRDYDAHQGCFFEVGRESEHLCAVFVHRTHRGQAAGGTRFWTYDTVEDFVRDGLRLSRAMGYKNALAGLWWGGGKGVIVRRPDVDHTASETRAAVYRDFGRLVSGLRGCHVAAEDVGTTPQDMAWVFRTTRFTTCIPKQFGGSGNPSMLTAKGVVVAMEAALEHLGKGTLTGKTVAMQGLGNVASFMIDELQTRGVAKIVGTDINGDTVELRRRQYRTTPVEISVARRDDNSIFAEPCDVFAPNAVGACLNPQTIPKVQTAIVCGAANNQLEDPLRDAEGLGERGILYVPDFVANRMGIVNCANEQYGVFDGDSTIALHLDRTWPHGVFRRCKDVFVRADAGGVTTAQAAMALAEELSAEPHPMWGSRVQHIMEFLIANGWADGEPASDEVAADEVA
jgi:glutamate dehydrogenase/leucine dehydrogenase